MTPELYELILYPRNKNKLCKISKTAPERMIISCYSHTEVENVASDIARQTGVLHYNISLVSEVETVAPDLVAHDYL